MKIVPIYLLSLLILFSCSHSPENKKNDPPVIPVADTFLESHPESEIQSEKTDTIAPNVLLGKINPSSDSLFSKISTKYTAKPNIYMLSEAYDAFEKMYEQAKNEGIRLEIVSATRTFDYQKNIWESKWTGAWMVEGKNLSKDIPDPVERATTILRFSSMPGTSRHHWGTDIDLNSLNNSYFESGKGKKEYDWLTANAPAYGFCQVYSKMGEDRPYGYQEEKWHWSYMPVSMKYLQAYQNQIRFTDINGFKGSETAEGLDVIRKYVAGISPACLDW